MKYYLATSNSGFPVLEFFLKMAFETQAWSAWGKVCFQPWGRRCSVKKKKFLLNKYSSLFETNINLKNIGYCRAPAIQTC